MTGTGTGNDPAVHPPTAPLDIASVLRDLRNLTAASRVTLRLDIVGMNFPVVAEAVDDAPTLSGNHSLDQRGLDTVRYLFRTRETLVQDDCEQADPRPPAPLMSAYGVKAQVLAPLLRSGEVLGWVSVHECRHSRHWSLQDVASVNAAAATVQRGLLGPTS